MSCQAHKTWELLRHGQGLFSNLQLQPNTVIEQDQARRNQSLGLLLWVLQVISAADWCTLCLLEEPLAVLEGVLV